MPFGELREPPLERREACREQDEERDDILERGLRSGKQYRRTGESPKNAGDDEPNDAAPLVPKLFKITE